MRGEGGFGECERHGGCCWWCGAQRGSCGGAEVSAAPAHAQASMSAHRPLCQLIATHGGVHFRRTRPQKKRWQRTAAMRQPRRIHYLPRYALNNPALDRPHPCGQTSDSTAPGFHSPGPRLGAHQPGSASRHVRPKGADRTRYPSRHPIAVSAPLTRRSAT